MTLIPVFCTIGAPVAVVGLPTVDGLAVDLELVGDDFADDGRVDPDAAGRDGDEQAPSEIAAASVNASPAGNRREPLNTTFLIPIDK